MALKDLTEHRHVEIQKLKEELTEVLEENRRLDEDRKGLES